MSHTKESIMEQAQVFASGWSLVGGIFDQGYALEDAGKSKDELAEMVGEVVQQRDELLAALEQARTAMRAFTDPEGNMPESTGEFDDLKLALIFAESAIVSAKGCAA